MKLAKVGCIAFAIICILSIMPASSGEVELIDDRTVDTTVEENRFKGQWFSADELALVDIYKKENGKWYGKIIDLKNIIENDPKSPAYGKECIDFRNPDPTLQKRMIRGIDILADFEWNGKKMVGGTIYDPDQGKTYKCQIAFKDKNTLKIRGYIGIPTLGRTEIWNRKVSEARDGGEATGTPRQ